MTRAGESAALLELFIDEAQRYLAADGGDQGDARQSLKQIAALLEGEPFGAEVAAAVAGGPALDRGRLVALCDAATARVKALRDRPAEAPPRERDDAGDGVVHDVHDESFDTSEYQTLRALFREEARESLEQMAHRLLGAPVDPGGHRGVLDELLRKAHSLKGSAGTVGLTGFGDAMHRLETALERIRAGQTGWSGALRDQLVEAVDGLRAHVEAGDDADAAARAGRRIGDALAACGRAEGTAPGSGQPSLDVDTRLGVADRRGARLTGQPGPPRGEPALLRVEPARVDRLMDAVGELVFDRTRIERRAAELGRVLGELAALRAGLADAAGDPERLAALDGELERRLALAARVVAELGDDAQALRRTSATLQDGLTSVRMESARSLFQRLAPQLRAIARAAGKRVELTTTGGETEFDKAVADEIVDPMIHLLRNAVAHGIEDPAERLRLGKPATGRITIGARHEAGGLVIEVADDGAGIDPQVLRRRLVATGRWTAARASLSADDDVLRALFDARLSSREQADELAGRGIGLDAVREAIARLGGELAVRSTLGSGTSFSMRLPLTTAVSNALLFKVAGQVYAVPNVHVLDTVQVETSSPVLPPVLRVRDEAVPLVALHAVLGTVVPSDARTVPAVLIEYVGRRLAMTCDKIIGPREIVVKSLGPLLAPLPLFAGGTISGSGKVQLILDPSALVRIAYPDQLPAAPPRRPSLATRVLLADDSRAIRESMTLVLERAGYAVDAVDTGLAAWELVRVHRYHALVTDLDMPELDGFGLIDRIRGHAEARELPIVIITSQPSPAALGRARELGVREVLGKPVASDRLLSALAVER